MTKYKIAFWVTTGFIFLTQGVVEAFMINNPVAQDGFAHLGYPLYFFYMLLIFKILGAIVLIVPQVPSRIKEWAYAGFSFDFIAAFVSTWVVDGAGPLLIAPLIAMVLLSVSYISYHKLRGTNFN